MAKRKVHLNKYLFEFLTVFVGVTLAFALNKWNENRKDDWSETKTLQEIRNGLKQDLNDLDVNIWGHQLCVKAAYYFQDLVNLKDVDNDSVSVYYFYLLRDFVSIQNKSGYESLKSKGLDLISNDSLRTKIIMIYDFDYQIIGKLEEEYTEMQFFEMYFHPMTDIMAPYAEFEAGQLTRFNKPVRLNPADKNKMLIYLNQIQVNRKYLLTYYNQVKNKVAALIGEIDAELQEW